MDSTSVSLLKRLGHTDDQLAWQRFVDLYAPLIFYWGRYQGLSASDAADLVQEVMLTVVGKIGEFQYDSNRRFRGWLHTITINRATDIQRRNQVRASETLDEANLNVGGLQAPVDLFAEVEYRGLLAKRALELMKAEFAERDWQACWHQVVDGKKAAEVAEEFGITINMAFLAKSRILARLRTELEGLFD